MDNNGWISVKERTPVVFYHNSIDRSDVVMCYGFEDFDDDEPHYFFAYMIGGKRFYGNSGECFKVTHWRQLPEPPKDNL